MNQDEKALKAFWCMYNSAAEKNLIVDTTLNSIYITDNGNIVARLSIGVRLEYKELKRKFFFGYKTESIEHFMISGHVTNVNRNIEIEFTIHDKDMVEETMNKISEIIDVEKKKEMQLLLETITREDLEKRQALDELLCD